MTTEKGWTKYLADILSVKYIKVKVLSASVNQCFIKCTAELLL